MKPRSIFLLGLLMCVLSRVLQSSEDAVHAAERLVDRRVISELLRHSTLVVVGEVVRQPEADLHPNEAMRRYGFPGAGALRVSTPFTVSIQRVLVGSVSTNDPIRVAVRRDEVKFRYPTREPLILFLKKAAPASVPSLSSASEWRTVSDYFAIAPHTLALERMIKAGTGARPHPETDVIEPAKQPE